MTHRRNIPNETYSFDKYDEFQISGRGQVFNVNKHDHPEITEVKVGDRIQINGNTWEVTGVEQYRKLIDITPPAYGDNYGLLVKPV